MTGKQRFDRKTGIQENKDMTGKQEYRKTKI